MKKIIVLKGEAGSGKSTALTKLVKDVFEIELYLPKIRKDLVISFKYKNKTIAIITVGDDVPKIKRHFNRIKDKFDVLICACRENGATFNFYNAFNRIAGYDVGFIGKKTNTDEDRERVISKIKEIIFKQFSE
ncbi:hypothetical protein J4212_03765 [Candidatus Woesearchaeota archaeon]|nr:hypothetical protein [Candidatus Woesearchaeota archaeon]